MASKKITKVVYFNSVDSDHLQMMLLEGLNKLHRSKSIDLRVVSEPEHLYADYEDLPVIGEDACVLSIDWADIIILDTSFYPADLSSDSFRIFQDTRIRSKKCVMVDSGDNDTFVESPSTFLAYFKKEIRYPHWDFVRSPNVRSLSNSYFSDIDPNRGGSRLHKSYYDDEFEKRDIDISFIAQNTNGIRRQVASFITHFADTMKLKAVVELTDGRQPMSHEKYLDILSRSKVSISCPGLSFDTLRYWEIPACGAVLGSFDLSYRLAIRDNFERDRHAVFFDSLHGLSCSILPVVTNRSVWKAMRSAADDHIVRHSSMQRAYDLINMTLELKSFASSSEKDK